MERNLLSDKRRNKTKRRQAAHRINVLSVAFMVFFIAFVVFALLIIQSLNEAKNEKKAFEELANITTEVYQKPDNPDKELFNVSKDSTLQIESAANTERFAELYKRNNDFVGWLFIDGTSINYPVMFTPSDPEYYLKRDFNKNNSQSGTPFIHAGCTLISENIIIHGHNMKNGTMFADLTRYQEESFWEEHPIINFDTMEQSAKYEIIAVFRDKVHNKEDINVFKYYNYGGDLTEEQYNEYITNVKKLASYDTEITATYGEQLVTLSTCSYHTNNGLFVIVGKKIS